MTTILFTLPAPTVFDESPQRIVGWQSVGIPKLVAHELTTLTPQLRDLDIHLILSSDLDEQSARVLARSLYCPNKLWWQLRRFNWGKLHGQRARKAIKVWSDMQQKWTTNPDAPVPGGDSLTSYEKRMSAARARLSKLSGHVTLVIARPQEIRALTQQPGQFSLHHLYQWEVPDAPRPA